MATVEKTRIPVRYASQPEPDTGRTQAAPGSDHGHHHAGVILAIFGVLIWLVPFRRRDAIVNAALTRAGR